MMPFPRRRGARQVRAQLEFALSAIPRPNVIVAAWRWRYELLAASLLAATWIILKTEAATAATVVLGAGLTATASLPSGRAFLVARAWCVVTPHRVRVGCAQAWIHSRNGRIPAILLTRREPFGERVYLWCSAGTSSDDFWSARALLAAVCWANEVHVSRHPRYAHLITLDVIRRR